MDGNAEFHSPQRGWRAKFRDAFRGWYYGVRGQTSFYVHFLATVLVILLASLAGVNRYEWCLLLLTITAVLVAEMFNSALEHLAKAVDTQHNPAVGAALDIGSGAVLLAACGALSVGLVILLPRLAALLEL